MNWSEKKVLVTGAGGFIGSHLAERLAALGARTRALVHYHASGSWGWLDHSSRKNDMEVVSGDIRDRDLVREAVRGVDTVFHLAALIAIPYSYQAPLSFIRTNVEGTLNVLQAVREFNTGRLVHTSTSETYGTARSVPIREDHPIQAQSPYAASKVAADKMVESFQHSYGVPAVTLRPFNTFGPRQSGRAVIPTIITQCLTEREVRLGNLHPTRDFNYVSNVVEGFIKAAVSPDALGRTINIGSGQEIRIEEVVGLVSEIAGKPVHIVQSGERQRPAASEVDRLLADNTQARRVLGWEPDISLEQGLKMTIDWIEANLDVYRTGVYVL